MKLFVGMDVSLEKTAICVISEHGKIVKEAQVASEPDALSCWICDQDSAITAIGLEAGPLSQWLHRGLSDSGLPVVLMEARQVKGALKAMPIKTDRRDAEGIARLLHLGWFRPVHCKSVSAQEVRAALSARKAVQQGFITLEMSLRGLLRNFGLKVGTISRGRFEQRIRELAAGNPMLEAATEPMLRARSALRRELAGLERNVRQLAQEDPVCRRLMSIAKDRDALLTFCDYPAEHWKHIRTSNPIESTFATVRHRTKRTKGCLSRKTGLAMAFKLMMSAQKKWRKLDGQNRLPEIIRGVEFRDGLTPYECICKIWTSEPDRFILNPIHQMPGLNT